MLKLWTEQFNVGPFIVFEESLGDRKFVHRGKQEDVRFSVALSYLGDLQIELMAQTNSAPSPYKEFLDGGGEGLHHVGFWPKNYEQACLSIEKSGFTEVSSIITPDGEKNISYFEGPAALGAMIELVPLTDARASYFSAIKTLTTTWDGSRPIRRFKSRTEFLASADYAATQR